ncbi:MAG TPA: metallophosphoesterase, partial [Gammaproteobacteria bacterium]|nr:metallophosphoesterase [Gammaproteobacteria bacterium]
GVERVVAVGDIHGDYDNFVAVLRDAGIINGRGNWIAGNTHFVQMGDLPDRGPDTDKVIALTRKLERQARLAGGMVHALIGNHEAMNMLGDLRYVHPGEYAALKSRQAWQLRDDYYRRVLEYLRETLPDQEIGNDHRQRWNQQFPLGYVEHRLAWAANGDIGSWVAEHNTIIRINRTLFVHAGISPEVLGRSLAEINEQISDELKKGVTGAASLNESEQGPLWYRGLATNDEVAEAPHVEALLAFYDADRIVVGHTPGYGTIMPRFGGKVLVIDTGISDFYGAHLASLVMEGERIHNRQRGTLLAIPTGDTELLPYLRSAAALEPEAAALQHLLTRLSTASPE